jgi:hypothetical protein
MKELWEPGTDCAGAECVPRWVQEFNGEEKILENECQVYCGPNTRKRDATGVFSFLLFREEYDGMDKQKEIYPVLQCTRNLGGC